jgi:hypothetical protein
LSTGTLLSPTVLNMREGHIGGSSSQHHKPMTCKKNTGFSLVDSLGNQMVEFHADDFKQGDEETVFGGNLSV